jgi:aspartyl aminopeptidase
MEVQDKDALQQMWDRLAVSSKLVWDVVKDNEAERQAIMAYGDRYKTFLDRAKTEREAVAEIERQAKALGFVDLARQESGPRAFYNYKNKTIVLVVQGRQPLTEGLRLVASHIASMKIRTWPS